MLGFKGRIEDRFRLPGSGHGLWPWAFARDRVPREGKSLRGRPERSTAESKGGEVGAPGTAGGPALFRHLENRDWKMVDPIRSLISRAMEEGLSTVVPR